MNQQFSDLAKSCKVPDGFMNIMGASGIEDAEAFALLACDEKEVKTDIFPIAAAQDTEVLKAIVDQVAVKKLWLACRKAGAIGTSASTQQSVEVGIPDETDSDIKERWRAVHGFTLPDSWLLSKPLQKKLWLAINASPVAVEQILMENLRLLSQARRSPLSCST